MRKANRIRSTSVLRDKARLLILPANNSRHWRAYRSSTFPIRAAAKSLTDLLAGQLQMVIDNLPTVWPQIRQGKLRALAVGTKTRSALVPEYPTMAEAGVPGYEASTASGLLAPAKTSRDIINRINRDVLVILRNPEVRERFVAQGLEVAGGTPEQYGQHLRNELAQNARVIKAANIRLEQ